MDSAVSNDKNSKTRLDDADRSSSEMSSKKMRQEEHAIDLINELKIDNHTPWACLQFYENNKIMFTQELAGFEPIKINAQTILNIKSDQAQSNEKYTDWEHAIGNGFILKRNEESQLSRIEMNSLDESMANQNRYKIFVGNKQLAITSNEKYEIYNGHTMLADIEHVKDIKSAYELAKSCYLIIAVYGNFMRSAAVLPLSYETIRKEYFPYYPYWFMLKLYPEYTVLDKQMMRFMN